MGEGATTPDKYIFSKNGPSYLISIDWSDSHYRTSVTASLIKGVSILERDRQKKRESQAKSWWEFFHFSLLETLKDESDSSIFGAVFKYMKTNLFDDDYMNIPHSKLPPHYVIVFRGTILRSKSMWRDLKLDIQCILHNLHQDTRVTHAIKAIENHVATHKNKALWLAGHSLGAAIALLAGKTMVSNGIPLETYLFNPPISSMPLEMLTARKIRKFLFRITENVIRYFASENPQNNEDESNLASWVPYIYVNPKDWICAEYIGYFNHKNFMNAIGAGKIENHDVRCGTSSDSTRIHLLISADVTINKNEMNWRRAHGLDQWWEPDLDRRANWQSYRVRPTIDDTDRPDIISSYLVNDP